MKIVNDSPGLFTPEGDIYNHLDHIVKIVTIPCPRCNFDLRLPEMYLTNYSKKCLDQTIEMLNNAMDNVCMSAIEVYGEDPRFTLLIKKLERIKKECLKLHLKVIKD